MTQESCNKNHSYYTEAKRITLVGILINSILTITKLLVGYLAHSQALIADGLHSGADIVSDSGVLIATYLGRKQADADHPYGHARIETVMVIALAILITLTGIGIIYHGLQQLFTEHNIVPPATICLWIALGSVIANEALFRYTLQVANRINSSLLKANAWHNRSDAASSFLVLLGIAGSQLGYPILDVIASIIVGLFIIKTGCWELAWSGLQELVDTGVGKEDLATIRQQINDVPGVLSIHQLRTRSMAGQIVLDVHVIVAPTISVSEGHYIGDQVQNSLLSNLPQVADVTVHIDPEDDEHDDKPNKRLPNRAEILKLLQTSWQDLPSFNHNDLTLHYLKRELHVELKLPLPTNPGLNIEQFLAAYQDALPENNPISKISFLFSANSSCR